MASPSDIRAGRAFVEVGADLTDLERGLRSARQKLEGFGAAVREVGSTLMVAGAGLAAPLVASVKMFTSMGDELDKMSKRTGLSVETLSALGYAAKLSGASLSDIETTVKYLQKNLSDAATGVSQANVNFAQLGVSVAKLQAMSPEEQFAAVSKRLAEIVDPAQRTQLAMSLLGRSGTMILPLTKDMAGLRAEAQRMGMVMSTEAASSAADLGDNIERVWTSVKMLMASVGSALAPALNELSATIRKNITSLTEWVSKNRSLVISALEIAAATTAAGAALLALGGVISGFGAVAGVIGTATTAVRSFGVAIAALQLTSLPTTIMNVATGFASAAKAMQVLTASMGTLSIGGWIARIAAFAGSWGAVSSALSIAASSVGAFLVAAAPLLGALALIAGTVALVAYDVKLISDIQKANKAIEETTQRCERLNQELLKLDKAGGGGNDLTFEAATESVDDYIQTLIKAGKTREQITQALQQRRDAEATRQEATSPAWTPKNAFSEEVYTGIQNESAQLTAALDDALSKGLDGYNDLFSEVAENSRKLTQQLAVEEAKRMGVMDKAIKERRKALQDFQNWQTEQQNTEKERDDAEASRKLAQTDPMQAVKQASDAYATSLKDANGKVAAAQKLLDDALKNPETDVKRNARGEVEIVNNEEVQTAIDSAKQAYKIAEDQKEILRNATQSALAAQKEAGDQAKEFSKRYREIETQRGNAENERIFDSQFQQAQNSPVALKALEQNTQSDFENALDRARQLKTQTEGDYARAKESGKKSDLETAKTDEKKTFTAESRVDVLRDRLLKIGAELDIPQRFDVAGTFNAAAAAEMGLGNSAADRTAKATEESARMLKWIKQQMDNGGAGFVAGV